MTLSSFAKRTLRSLLLVLPGTSAFVPKLAFVALAAVLPSVLPAAGEKTAPDAGQTRWERQAAHKLELVGDVVWLSHEPPEFVQRRGGAHGPDVFGEYSKMVSPENIRRMAAAGVRFNQIYFYKGFGMEYERANFEQVKRSVALMHELGMKTSVYIGGSMFVETFYRETPAARDWERRDQHDAWIPYGTQTFRHYACTNEPAYRDYLKRVIRYAVEEVGTDEVFFDNLMLQDEPRSCHCPRCVAAFKAFLGKRYPTPESVRRRFGLPSVESIRVPEWESETQAKGVTQVDDPVLQEWVRFRNETLADYTKDLADYAKSLNPAVAVNLNLKGIYSFNRYWTNAIYHPLYAGHCDFVHFDTGGYDARIDSDTGALVSQIRSYKLAWRLKTNCLDVMKGDDLRTAVHMAFGYQKPLPGWPGAPWHEGLNNDFTPLLEFFREYNERYFTGTAEVADVAVLRTWASMAYSIHATHETATLAEQVLIQHKVPFALLHEEEIDAIDGFGAVMLAGQECLSRPQIDRLLRYVGEGGTLVLIGKNGVYNEWRETWPSDPLPVGTLGKGRVVRVSKLVPGLPRSEKKDLNEDPEPGATLKPGVALSPAQWVLPFNHEEIGRTVVGGLPRGLSVETSAPLTTVLELLKRDATRETILHLVNFDKKKPTQPIEVSLRAQYEGPVGAVTLFSPDKNDPVRLPFVVENGRVRFTVPSLRLYSLLVVSQETAGSDR